MRISDWSSDVCSSDLLRADISAGTLPLAALLAPAADGDKAGKGGNAGSGGGAGTALPASRERWSRKPLDLAALRAIDAAVKLVAKALVARSEEHTSELQSLMSISYAVFCLKKKKTTIP